MKGRGCGTRYDRQMLRQQIRSRRAGAVVLGEKRQCLQAHRELQNRRRTRHEVYVKRAQLVPCCSERRGRYVNDGIS